MPGACSFDLYVWKEVEGGFDFVAASQWRARNETEALHLFLPPRAKAAGQRSGWLIEASFQMLWIFQESSGSPKYI